MRIVAVSDTHCKHNKLKIPPCDLLIHAGDWTYQGMQSEVRPFAEWLNDQPARNIVIVPGNHEVYFEDNWPESNRWILDHCPDVQILINDTIEVNGVKIFGSAWTPWFHQWAYNAGRTISEAAHYRVPFIGDKWAEIQPGTNIVITHGPAYGILDELVYPDGTPKGEFVGCVELRKKIEEIKPDLHFCGHIHGQHGQVHINGTSFYNVSICDELYYPSNPATVIEYEKE